MALCDSPQTGDKRVSDNNRMKRRELDRIQLRLRRQHHRYGLQVLIWSTKDGPHVNPLASGDR